MRVEQAFPGARVIDSLPLSQGAKAEEARAIAASGVEGVIGYLGAMSPARLAMMLDAGLSYMPVTFAAEYEDGADDEVIQLRALGIPGGATVWLDLEGQKAWATPPRDLMAKITTWANRISGADGKGGIWMPGLYVGAPQPLTGIELYQLPVVRYWLGIGRCIDRNGVDAYPSCGWCLRQDWHNQGKGMMWKDTGVFVDTNHIQCDHRGRLPSWVVA